MNYESRIILLSLHEDKDTKQFTINNVKLEFFQLIHSRMCICVVAIFSTFTTGWATDFAPWRNCHRSKAWSTLLQGVKKPSKY